MDARRIAANGWIYGYPMVENYRTLYTQAVAADGFGRFRDTGDLTTAWLDLRAEPYVISVPAIEPYYVLSLHDLDTCYVGFIGSRVTGSGPGAYLIAGPGWDGEIPEGVNHVLQADTELVGVIGRGGVTARDLGLAPLHAHTHRPAPPEPPEPHWPIWYDDAVDGPGFFAYLDFLLGFCPDEHQGELTSLASRAAPAEVRAGIEDGRRQLRRAAADPRHWYGTRHQRGRDYLARAVGVREELYGLPVEEVFPVSWQVEGGARTLELREPPPAKYLWTVSDGARTVEGQLTTAFDHAEPYTVTLRLYGPDPAVLSGEWRPPELTPPG